MDKYPEDKNTPWPVPYYDHYGTIKKMSHEEWVEARHQQNIDYLKTLTPKETK
jgi:hypothetical protein